MLTIRSIIRTQWEHNDSKWWELEVKSEQSENKMICKWWQLEVESGQDDNRMICKCWQLEV